MQCGEYVQIYPPNSQSHCILSPVNREMANVGICNVGDKPCCSTDNVQCNVKISFFTGHNSSLK